MSAGTAGRKEALAAYRRGALEEALAIQRAVMAVAAPPPEERDFLTMALLLHAKKDFPAAAATLSAGVKRYPIPPRCTRTSACC